MSDVVERLTKAVHSGDFARARSMLGSFGAEVSAALAGPEGRQSFAAALELLERLRVSAQCQRAHCEKRLAGFRDRRPEGASRRSTFEVTG